MSKTLKQHRISEPDARVAYLALGPDRSLVKLRGEIGARSGRSPAMSTLERWSSQHRWAALAAAHDAKVTGTAIQTVEVQAAKMLTDYIADLLQVVDAGLSQAKMLPAKSFGEAVNGAVAALKAILLLSPKAIERRPSEVARLNMDVKARLARIYAIGQSDAMTPRDVWPDKHPRKT